jgi:hypothetical protein
MSQRLTIRLVAKEKMDQRRALLFQTMHATAIQQRQDAKQRQGQEEKKMQHPSSPPTSDAKESHQAPQTSTLMSTIYAIKMGIPMKRWEMFLRRRAETNFVIMHISRKMSHWWLKFRCTLGPMFVEWCEKWFQALPFHLPVERHACLPFPLQLVLSIHTPSVVVQNMIQFVCWYYFRTPSLFWVLYDCADVLELDCDVERAVTQDDMIAFCTILSGMPIDEGSKRVPPAIQASIHSACDRFRSRAEVVTK